MENSLFHVHHFLKQVLIEWLIFFSKVKYNSGPGEMLVPIGSRIPFFTAVPEMTVCTNLGGNCGAVKIQIPFLFFIFFGFLSTFQHLLNDLNCRQLQQLD